MNRTEQNRTEQNTICAIQPKKYMQQHSFRECGLFTIKTIIETIYPEYNQPAKEYTISRFHRWIKFSLPIQLSLILKKYNIRNRYGKYKGKNMKEKINFLKNHIKKGPIILLIAHAYTKRSMFDSIKAIFCQHYISIWGYNDQKEVFYCYDSHTELKENNLPIGNIELHYEELITYRNFAGLGLFKKRYILIENIEK